MSETTGKRSVRITFLHSGLSPPIFILASFTDPPWEPHPMKSAAIGGSGVNGDNPTLKRVDYMFWRRFDIYPGVWRYRFCIGLNNCLVRDHEAEAETDSSGEGYNVLRVEDGGPTFFQSPAPVPVWLNEIAFSQASGQVSSSDSDSWQTTEEDPSDGSNSQEPGGSCSSFVTNPFSSSPVRAATIHSATSDSPESDEEQRLLLHQATETISQSSSRSSSEASVESKDQDGFFAVCWQRFIAWIYALFARLLGQASNA